MRKIKIYEYPRDFENGCPKGTENCVLALGFFDGVHVAHRDLLLHSKQLAKKLGMPCGVFTFSTDSSVKSNTPRIYGDEEKYLLLESCGAEFIIVADFSAICSVGASEFVERLLVSECKCSICVAGFNFRFGKGAQGTAKTLEKLMAECGKSAVIREEMKHNGTTVSSTLIRTLLERGQADNAGELLGSPYFLRGKVVHGNSVGKRLGYPTVNTAIDTSRVVPRLGVYRCAVPVGGKIYSAVTNIGKCPTFGEREIHAETYILDFKGDLYERTLNIYLLGFLREEKLFESADELIKQIEKDQKQTIKENGEVTWQALGLN